jgi:hypothetical protein
MRRSKGMGKSTSVTALLQPARLLKQTFRVVSARCISALKEEFISASSIFAGPNLEFTGTQAVYQTGAPSTVRQQDLLVGPRLPTNAQERPRVRLEIESNRSSISTLIWQTDCSMGTSRTSSNPTMMSSGALRPLRRWSMNLAFMGCVIPGLFFVSRWHFHKQFKTPAIIF